MEEFYVGVLVDYLIMDVDKVNLSMVFVEVVNGLGNGLRNCYIFRMF